MSQTKYRPTFYLTINSLFILLIVGVGAILTWQNYQSTEKIVLKAANKVYDQASHEVAQNFKHTYKPVFKTINFLARDPLLQATTLEERLEALRVLSAELQNQPEISAIQVGYGNGDFFIMRSIPSEVVRKLFKATNNSTYVVDHITADPSSAQRMLYRFYYDDKMQEVGRNNLKQPNMIPVSDPGTSRQKPLPK